MEEQWDRAHLLGYLRTWSATARYVDAQGVDPVAVLEERLSPCGLMYIVLECNVAAGAARGPQAVMLRCG